MDNNEVKKDLYKSKVMANFSHYVSGNLYYTVQLADGVYQFPIETIENKEKFFELIYDNEDIDKIKGINVYDEDECNYGVSVPTLKLSDDLAQTTFNAEIRGSELNRWITKAIAKEEFIKVG